MKILILGKNGMVGSMLTSYYGTQKKYNIDSWGKQDFDALKSDIPDLQQYDYVINCIGLIKQKSLNKALLYELNAHFPNKLATKCKRLIHISSDCVFSGKKLFPKSYTVFDKPDANDDYGKSKAAGECFDKAMILRTSVIGPSKDISGLFEWCRQANDPIKGYSNHYWSGITTLELAKIIDQIISQDKFSTEIYQISSEPITKLHLLQQINQIFGLNKIIVEHTDIETINRVLQSNIIALPILDQLKELYRYISA